MRPIVVTVGPLATADPDGISLSQRHTGAFGFAINGALTSGADDDAICLAQAVGSATTLTIAGALASGGQARLGDLPGKYVTITSAGNDSGITFTVRGINYGPNGQYAVTEVITGSNTSIVASTKRFYIVTSVTSSAAAAGNVSVGISGTWTADKPRQVLFTPAGNDGSITYTITGTDWNGDPITEVVAGVASPSTAVSLISFATISSIVTSGSTGGLGTIGTNGVATSRPVLIDNWAFPQIALQATVSGTVNYTVRQSLDDPTIVSGGIAGVTWVNHSDSALVAATATAQGNYAYPPQVVQLLLNSGTGTTTLTINQAANVPF